MDGPVFILNFTLRIAKGKEGLNFLGVDLYFSATNFGEFDFSQYNLLDAGVASFVVVDENLRPYDVA